MGHKYIINTKVGVAFPFTQGKEQTTSYFTWLYIFLIASLKILVIRSWISCMMTILSHWGCTYLPTGFIKDYQQLTVAYTNRIIKVVHRYSTALLDSSKFSIEYCLPQCPSPKEWPWKRRWRTRKVRRAC